MSAQPDFKEAVKNAIKSTFETLSQVFSFPEETPFDKELFENLVTQVVNLRTPGLSPTSDEFYDSYDAVVDEISSNCQGRRRRLIITAQDILQQEQKKQEHKFVAQ